MMSYEHMLYIPAHTDPNKSHFGEGVRAFSTRGNRHTLSHQNRLCLGQFILIHSGWESSVGKSSPKIGLVARSLRVRPPETNHSISWDQSCPSCFPWEW